MIGDDDDDTTRCSYSWGINSCSQHQTRGGRQKLAGGAAHQKTMAPVNK